MQPLYYVRVYHPNGNCWSRYVVTASTAAGARQLVVQAYGYNPYDVREGIFICHTSNDVFMEL